MISLPVCVSRLPVGSSARMIEGSVDQCAGDGDALALPAGQLVRLVIHALLRSTWISALLRLGDARRGRRAVVDQRQFHVVQRGGAGQQVESLKDEADFLVADLRQFVVVHRTDQTAVDVVLALRSAYRGSRSGSSASICRNRTAP
jgi:hypothetical protein